MQYFNNKYLLLFVTILFLVSCNSIRRYNEKFDEKIAPEKLQKDVTYIHKKLTKLHPQLYYYISKKDFDFKFDSLKKTIQEPLTRKEFFFKLSPIIASIKQGHASVNVPIKRLTKDKKKVINSTNLLTPMSDLEVEFYNQKLYVVKNKSVDSSIQIGTEIISVDSVKPIMLFDKYYNTFASDGLNTTFKKSMLNENIFAYYFVDQGYKDSVKVKLNDKGDTLIKMIKRNTNKVSKSPNKPGDRKNLDTKNCHLSFVGKDSNIALLKIDDFMSFSYERFFRKIDSVKSSKLIIDLRGNPGGAAFSCRKLFSYLIDTSYYFFNPYEVTSRTSLLQTRRFREKKMIGKLFHLAFLPITILRYGIRLSAVKKKEDRYFYIPILYDLKVTPKKKYNFKNKIYVITNGGTFSSSCILSSNLKGYKLATFVGEETGGEYNGTCAGQMPTFILPYSKLKINFGIMYIKASCSTDVYGHGIMPDIEIIPTLEDRIHQHDPELEWILNDSKNQKQLD